eukprot:SAG22_NODE_6255_length_879_cov_1.262821_1_plen_131_part_00
MFFAQESLIDPVFSAGNFLNGTDPNMADASARIPRKASQGKGFYDWRGAITLEAQQYIDAANHPNFPQVTLEPGQRYAQVRGAAVVHSSGRQADRQAGRQADRQRDRQAERHALAVIVVSNRPELSSRSN